MERVIKFRGKSKLGLNPWVKGFFLEDESENRFISFKPEEDDFQLTPVEYESVGQFTGLLDKNGVEIYEGDILSGFISGSYKVVEFKNGCFYTKSNVDHSNYRLGGWDKSILEVVGNIYANPELLSTQLK